jgi:hypothetical protein
VFELFFVAFSQRKKRVVKARPHFRRERPASASVSNRELQINLFYVFYYINIVYLICYGKRI